MRKTERLQAENRHLRERLCRMGNAFTRINESLDIKTVLQGVLDGARSLTDAKYGMLTLLDDGRRVQNCMSSGMTPNQTRRIWRLPQNEALFEYFAFLDEPLRLRDLHVHIERLGLPEFRPPMPVSPKLTFLVAPIHHGGERVGTLFLAEKEGSEAFTPEDEETLVMFASQAALVIANARRHQEEQRARADLEALIDTSPVGVVVWNATTGKLVSFNREMCRLVKYLGVETRSPRKALKILTLRRADGSEVTLQKLSVVEALSRGETVRAEEVVILVPDGRGLTALMNATPIKSVEGGIASYVVTLQDMTHMEELDRLRAEFLAMVTHELRAPLAAIKGSTATALSEPFPFRPAEVAQFLRIIEEQADNMGVLINDLVDVARIETGTLIVTPVSATVTGLLEQARNTFSSGWDRDSIHIESAPGLPPVMADPGRVVQVLVNLLTNAAQNSPENSPIRVSAEKESGHVEFVVADHGRGVPAEHIPHLFRKSFPRERDAGLECETGAGWGLSICRGIVEAHGGRIWAESEGPGTGTRFKFTIPVAYDGGDGTGGGKAAPIAFTRAVFKNRTKILVVDDDPQTLRSVRKALVSAGFVPVVTGNPNEALKLVEEHSPELVLLDLVLPGSDGVELMQNIVEKAEVPVIFLSAYGHEDAIARAFDSGASDYVVKPFSPTELVARIRAILRKRFPPETAVPSRPFVMGDLKIDYARRRVTMAGESLILTRIEYRLLQELSVYAGQTVLHEDLLKQVWGRSNTDDKRPLHAAVKNIRRKLGDSARAPTFIFNQPRVGYRIGKAE